MSVYLFFIILSTISLSLLFQSSEQVSPTTIIDSKTGKELTILTHTYYAIQNQQTLRFLIWFGKNGTVDSDLEVTQGKYWHIFEKLEDGWYKMSHHFGSHTVKIAKSHEQGYYHIYNKDCYNGEHPNGDADERGTIMCFVAEKGNMLEYNWRFLKKPDTKEDHQEKNHSGLQIMIMGIGFLIIVCALFAVLQPIFRILTSPENSVQVIYSQNNDGFIDTPVFPTFPSSRFEKV